MRALASWLVFFELAGAVASCSTSDSAHRSGTETNWLRTCSSDSECGPLSCECGVCTSSCNAASDCPESGAVCVHASLAGFDALCGAPPAEDTPSGICLPGCASGCELGTACKEGACVPENAQGTGAGGGSGSGGRASTGGAGAGGSSGRGGDDAGGSAAKGGATTDGGAGFTSGGADDDPITGDCVARTPGEWTKMSTLNEPAPILAFNQSPLLDNRLFWSGTELFVVSPNGTDGRYDPCLDRWEIVAEPPGAISALVHVEAGVYAATYATGGIPDGLLFLDFASATWKQRSFAGFYSATGVMTRATERYVYRFGGIAEPGNPYNVLSNQGARYDQGRDAWKDLATEAAPAPRLLSGNVTTAGDELVVWGGALSGPPATTVTPGDPVVRALVETPGVVCPDPVPEHCSFGDGAIYDPVTERWRSMTRTGAPKPRRDHVLASTGTHVLVFGGSAYEYSAADSYSKWMRYGDGGLYELATGSWTPIVGPPELAGASFSAEWRNQRLIVWADTGGQGFIYDLSTRSWQPVPTPPSSGLKALDPASNTWSVLPERTGTPSSPAMIWTGSYWLQWGGIRYMPATMTGCENVPPGTGCDPLGPEPYGVGEGAVLVPKP